MNKDKNKKTSIFRQILWIGRKHYGYLFVGFLAMLVSGFISIWPSYFLKLLVDIVASGDLLTSSVELKFLPKQLINYGIPNFSLTVNPKELIHWIPLTLILVFSFEGFLRFLQVFNTRFFGVLVANELRILGHKSILKLSLLNIRKRNTGDLTSCLTNDLNLVQSLLSETLGALINDSARALALSIWLLVVDWKLSLIGVLIIPPFFLLVSKYSKKLRNLANQGQEANATLASFISETVQGIDLLQLFNFQAQRKELFLEKSNYFVRIWKKQLKTDALINPLISLFSAAGIGGVFWVALNLILSEEMSVGDCTSYLVATLLLFQPLRRLFRVSTQINQISGTCERIFKLINGDNQLTSATNNIELEEDSLADESIAKAFTQGLPVEFKNVSFSYNDSSPIVLKKLNLKIKEGEKVALVGTSGGGKSSLIALIPRLYEISEGQLFVGNKNVLEYSLPDLRSLISYVTQDPFLFSGTLKDNLLIAKPNATEEELNNALKLAKVDFLNKIENGINGIVGERGANLSGGQRQRISVARAFLKNSPLLILDEPTSSLDSESAKLINQSIKDLMQGRTVIMVTHKLDSLDDFDRILSVKDGQVSESEFVKTN
ncbi:MAG TPA: ABC transporter ATP-binding protein [Vampirovibrionales bacterium]